MNRRVLVVVFLGTTWAAPLAAQTTPQEAGKMFQQRCQNCHQTPDPAFATDRAFLDRIHHTA
jgi:mono/diheme cytochrome c family protein